MGWQKRYGPIWVHWNEPIQAAHGGGTLPCFAPITQQEFNGLTMELRCALYDPCTLFHQTSLEAELGNEKSRRARFREINERRAYYAEARAAKSGPAAR